MISCGCKNGHKKGIMVLKEIGLYAQICKPMIGRDLYKHLMSSKTFTLITNKMSSKSHETNGYNQDLDLLIISH